MPGEKPGQRSHVTNVLARNRILDYDLLKTIGHIEDEQHRVEQESIRKANGVLRLQAGWAGVATHALLKRVERYGVVSPASRLSSRSSAPTATSKFTRRSTVTEDDLACIERKMTVQSARLRRELDKRTIDTVVMSNPTRMMHEIAEIIYDTKYSRVTNGQQVLIDENKVEMEVLMHFFDINYPRADPTPLLTGLKFHKALDFIRNPSAYSAARETFLSRSSNTLETRVEHSSHEGGAWEPQRAETHHKQQMDGSYPSLSTDQTEYEIHVQDLGSLKSSPPRVRPQRPEVTRRTTCRPPSRTVHYDGDETSSQLNSLRATERRNGIIEQRRRKLAEVNALKCERLMRRLHQKEQKKNKHHLDQRSPSVPANSGGKRPTVPANSWDQRPTVPANKDTETKTQLGAGSDSQVLSSGDGGCESPDGQVPYVTHEDNDPYHHHTVQLPPQFKPKEQSKKCTDRANKSAHTPAASRDVHVVYESVSALADVTIMEAVPSPVFGTATASKPNEQLAVVINTENRPNKTGWAGVKDKMMALLAAAPTTDHSVSRTHKSSDSSTLQGFVGLLEPVPRAAPGIGTLEPRAASGLGGSEAGKANARRTVLDEAIKMLTLKSRRTRKTHILADQTTDSRSSLEKRSDESLLPDMVTPLSGGQQHWNTAHQHLIGEQLDLEKYHLTPADVEFVQKVIRQRDLQGKRMRQLEAAGVENSPTALVHRNAFEFLNRALRDFVRDLDRKQNYSAKEVLESGHLRMPRRLVQQLEREAADCCDDVTFHRHQTASDLERALVDTPRDQTPHLAADQKTWLRATLNMTIRASQPQTEDNEPVS